MSRLSNPTILSEPSDEDDQTTDITDPILLDLTPPTLTHLSSIPEHLRPLSPYLAALHDARLRLISSPPQPGSSRSPIRWCNTCGSIREDYPIASPSKSPLKSSKSRPKAAVRMPGSTKCNVCGNGYKRITAKSQADSDVLKSFRPARTVRRSLRGTKSMTDIPNTTPVTVEGDVFSADAIQPDELIAVAPKEPEDDPMDAEVEPAQPSTPLNVASQRPDPPGQATPLASPSLRYIPSTSPTPPTYVQPPPVRVSPTKSGAGAGPPGKAGKADTDGVKKKKKKKASGLAKLLAQSKEREEGQISGKWGFG